MVPQRRHDGARYFVGGRQVDEGAFWEEVRRATAISAYDHGTYEVRLTPKGIAAALRIAEARRRAQEAEAEGAGGGAWWYDGDAARLERAEEAGR